MPSSEDTLLMFVGHLAQQGLSHQTIKVHLSVVRNLHVTAGLRNKFTEQLTPRLEMVLKGIKKDKTAATTCTQLPITVEIMEKLKCAFSKKPTDHNNIIMWASCSLAFFGFLRCSNSQCYRRKNIHQVSIYLSKIFPSIAVSHPPGSRLGSSSPKLIPSDRAVRSVWGKQKKKSVLLALSYHTWRRGRRGTVRCFIMADGTYLTRGLFAAAQADTLHEAGIDSKGYNTDNFRIGTATTANDKGISDVNIGRWKSSTYVHHRNSWQNVLSS